LHDLENPFRIIVKPTILVNLITLQGFQSGKYASQIPMWTFLFSRHKWLITDTKNSFIVLATMLQSQYIVLSASQCMHQLFVFNPFICSYVSSNGEITIHALLQLVFGTMFILSFEAALLYWLRNTFAWFKFWFMWTRRYTY